jgi:hypothetical protein
MQYRALATHGATIKNKRNKMATLGYINKNPGNIRNIGAFKFAGEITQPGDTFRKFSTMEYGYRALMTNLQAYIKDGTVTPLQITYRWAPYGDGKNNPDNYAANISRWTGLDIHTPVMAHDVDSLQKLAYAISRQENGIEPDARQIQGGAALLGVTGAMAPVIPSGDNEQKKKQQLKTAALIGVALLALYIGYVQLRKK